LFFPFDPSPAFAAALHHQKTNKKTDVAEHPQVSSHVGLLFNEPPGHPGCFLFSHPTTSTQHFSGSALQLASAPLTTVFYSAGPGTQGDSGLDCAIVGSDHLSNPVYYSISIAFTVGGA
jgi:hypothetical protein